MDTQIITQAFQDRSLLPQAKEAVFATIEALDKGKVRVAEKINGEWVVNSWVKEAILLYFALTKMETWEAGPMQFRDLIPVKKDLEAAGIRVVPPAVARYGCFLEPGAIMMPSYVNIGAYIGAGTMVDIYAAVGSCAQIGRNVHLAAGVVVGGVLEPAVAAPVIIEDGCFIGSRAVVVEGAHIGEEAVLGANVSITATSRIVDVTGPEPVITRGYVPPRSVVIPGTMPKQFEAGTFNISCALIIGKRKPSTDKRISLNEALRTFGVQV